MHMLFLRKFTKTFFCLCGKHQFGFHKVLNCAVFQDFNLLTYMCGIFKYNLWLLWISDDPEYENFEFPAVMKKPTIWEIRMTITCLITIQHFYDLRLPIIWLDKYIIIQKMSNMKGLYQVPLYYFLCTTDRVKYTHFVIQFWNIGSVDMEGEDDWFDPK